MQATADEKAALLAATTIGDEVTFGAIVERHRRELQVHCYRMLGSFEDSEDLVQETFLRAWRGRTSFEGRSTPRTWLYRIATHACLDALDRHARRVLPPDLMPAADPTVIPMPPASDLPWIQPYPDRLLESMPGSEIEPDTAAVSKETIELAFIAALQHIPPRQRAVLIARDVLGSSASETAALLDVSVASVNSSLQRARGSLRRYLPPDRLQWVRGPRPSEEEHAVLRRYMDALDKADIASLAALLRADARMVMPPLAAWYDGREAVVAATTLGLSALASGNKRMIPTAANRQPATAMYFRAAGESEHRALVLNVLRIEDGHIVDITGFPPEMFEAFELPSVLPSRQR
jgi:RNA polymerase sigma-70 factor, ECF subfamily